MENNITLIKVPKFLATQWRSADTDTTIGLGKKSSTGELEELIIKSDDGMRRLKCRKSQLCNPIAVMVDEKGLTLTNIGGFSQCLTVYPPMDQNYRDKLKERHISANIQKTRSTTNETREDPSFDSANTVSKEEIILFKYFNPKSVTIANMVGYESKLEDITAIKPKKDKVKKYASLDADELKMKIFKVFESDEAKDGIQLKRVVQLINQPMQAVKNAVEEIAVQKRRMSDHKMVYYLKDHYSPGNHTTITRKHPSTGNNAHHLSF